MNWIRVIGYGIALWAVPFATSFVLFGVREANRALFESIIVVVGVTVTVVAALAYFRDVKTVGPLHGLVLGSAWAAISVIIDLPIFLVVFQMTLPDYAVDIALTYLAFPIIVARISLAQSRRPASVANGY
ncbi:hypothetical protein [Devosia sp. SL43]|uniref:hypothetical protein n=1 Tax=Devosia sp. SL43 TaxID=2806348 RepID=UPI001F266CA1|nr:hypothetical protein [Devosia sp. SL43]UJW85012.1 hypothetical protein IM737_16610 [Devosia sp. SL43]